MPTDNLTIKQAARLLGVHHITVRRWIKTGKIKATWEYEGDQGKRLISRDQVIELLEKQGKTTPESGQLEQVEKDQVALSINKVNVYLKHLFKVERENRSTELKNAIASLSVKLFIAIGLVLIAGIAITLSIAYIAGVKQEANQKVLKGEMFKGFAYLQESQKSDQESLKTILAEEMATASEQIRDLAAADQATRKELMEATRTGVRATKAEIQTLRESVEAQSAGILALAEQMKAINDRLEKMEQEPAQEERKPTPASAATVPTAPKIKPKKEESSGFLGIF